MAAKGGRIDFMFLGPPLPGRWIRYCDSFGSESAHTVPHTLFPDWSPTNALYNVYMDQKGWAPCSLGDPRGCEGHAPPSPIYFIFMQFWAKILPNSRLLAQIQELAHSPRLGNTGSTTELLTIMWPARVTIGGSRGGRQGRELHRVQILSFSCSFWQKFEK